MSTVAARAAGTMSPFGVTGGRHVPLLALQGIVKTFPGTRALAGVTLDVQPGEVHAIVGENGAGKSTLVKILSGSLTPDEGAIEVEGRPMTIREPRHALAAGIATAYQEINLVPRFSARLNIALGAEEAQPGTDAATRAGQLLAELHAEFDPDTPVEHLTRGEKQIVQIARALCLGHRVVVLDEPTEVLSPDEVNRLFAILRSYREHGRGIIYISHRLSEVLSLADRVTVLRDGQKVATLDAAATTEDEIIQLMVGRKPVAAQTGGPAAAVGEVPILRLHSLTSPGNFYDISLTLRPGEIIGLAGIPGSGRSQLLYGIMGALPVTSGTLEVAGESVRFRSPHDAVRRGLAFVPSDRKRNALVLPQPVRTNVVLGKVPVGLFGFRNHAAERTAARHYVERLGIRPPDIERPVGVLSGGNQQKVLLARIAHQGAKIVLIDEPTQGVDVAGKVEIHGLIRHLAADGAGVIFSSAEMGELMTLAHRIIVMRQGRISGEHAAEEADPEAILREALPTADR